MMKKKPLRTVAPPPKAPALRYWLFKSEPTSYSIADLERDKTSCWDGVRNYQARNTLRDDVRVGDFVFFYHSNAEPPSVVGVMKVVRSAYPDHTAFDKKHHHFDPKSIATAPTWFMVDVEFVERLKHPVSLDHLRTESALEKMVVLQRGSRLSIQPVTATEWSCVLKLGRQNS